MRLRICTGLKGFPSERRIYESTFGRTDQIALITCLKKLNVSGASLKFDLEFDLKFEISDGKNLVKFWERTFLPARKARKKFGANIGANFGASFGENCGKLRYKFRDFFRKFRSAERRC